MTNALPTRVTPGFPTLKRFVRRPLTVAALSLGILLSASPLNFSASASEQVGQTNLNNGTYTFGESREPGQIGATYMVFEVIDGDVIGGFYQPRSSFDCFYGEIAGNEMALTVINSYEQTEHPFSLALDSREQVASQGEVLTKLVPEGFYGMPAMSETDQEVLQTCQSDL